MLNNQFDLCLDTLTLDYGQLVRVATIALAYTRDSLERQLRAWHNIDKKPCAVDAEWLLRDAEALVAATTALHYLTRGQDREEVKIVNR